VPGLPDDAYETDGQLTKRWVRAITLAALAPAPARCCGTSVSGQRLDRRRMAAGRADRPRDRHRTRRRAR
jgi:hypothetical protein